MVKYSVIVPVYNRPEELKELLDSLTLQRYGDVTEVIVVEDGSQIVSEEAVERYRGQLDVRYVWQENGGPASARNRGAVMARGEWLLFFDSDCTLPSDFMERVGAYVEGGGSECFGTRDEAHKFFSPIQKAISYSMTSFWTTGGIRGGSERGMDRFYPRSYSMGVRRDVFEAVGGFSGMRYGEDIDFCMKVREAGYGLGLVVGAFVYHKRRSTFRSFFKQVFCSGTARVDLAKRHRGALKLVHVLPSVALLCCVGCVVCGLLWRWWCVVPIVGYGLLLFVDSWRVHRSVRVGLLSVWAGGIQVLGYGAGFLYNGWLRLVLGRGDSVVFRKTLYS